MEVYLKSFVEQCKALAKRGFKWVQNGTEVVSKAFAICCSVDSAARLLLQNTIKFNGFYGCPWCLHPGVTVNGEVRYPVRRNVYQERDSAGAVQMMYRSSEMNTTCFGHKGPSVLMNLPGFDVIESFVPDYLHSVLLGVTRTLTKLWFDSKYSSEDFYIGAPSALSLIDRRMGKIRPPSTTGRFPRGISERKLWKAQEYRSWLLYYSLPVLGGILPRRYFMHFSLLVRAVFLLLQDTVEGADLNVAQDLLSEFVVKYNMLYGDYCMVFNVHLLPHLAKDVARWGPLWTHSTFVFESFNGVLVKFVKGNRGVAEQVLAKAMLKQAVFSYVQLRGSYVLRSYLSLLKNKKVASFAEHVSGAVLLGRGRASTCTSAERNCIRSALGRSPDNFLFFHRMVFNSTMYHSTSYKLPKRTNGTTVALHDGGFGEIQSIFVYRENSHKVAAILIREFVPFEASFFHGGHITKGQFSSLKVVPVSAISCKVINVVIDGISYVSNVANTHEIN
ncbi:uncharacterized protein LOC135379646 [Ornithodoros turicata]|uniref:uncharacterized protein LOC135379646 n=1 Tax=Ornithodoros turicata TaxID=34597 RepID=UPI0031395FA2